MARSRMNQVRLDRPGIRRILRSAEVAAAVHREAEDIADALRVDDAIIRNDLVDAVRVDDYTTDRAASSVTIAHPAGVPIQAKDGSLTRAAEGTGHKVTAR